jgi:uncharacterized iron-regulated protein
MDFLRGGREVKKRALIFWALLSMSALGEADAMAASQSLPIYQIYEPARQRSMEFSELTERLASYDLIVLGEKHNTAKVQLAQAAIIEDVVLKSLQMFDVSWEFLNASSSWKTAEVFDRFVSYEITALEFLTETQGPGQSTHYAPILDVIRAQGGNLRGVNLSRAEKAPIVKGGISAADPALIPDGFEMGGPNYFARFEEAMGGHATPEQLKNYYAAQCLTDDVMAYRIVHGSRVPLKFLIAGGFHTDYRDGVVRRIEARAPGVRQIVVRIEDAADYLTSEIPAFFHDPRYGDRADFVILVNQPRGGLLR